MDKPTIIKRRIEAEARQQTMAFAAWLEAAAASVMNAPKPPQMEMDL